MDVRTYEWQAVGEEHELRLVKVPGTKGSPYLFGAGAHRKPIEIEDFHIASTPVTQALWMHVMGANPARRPDLKCPIENVSWEHVTQPGGFLDRINESGILTTVAGNNLRLKFRLPSETEWEYAARGGPHWRDDFQFSGSNNADEVAWYGPRWTAAHQAVVRLVGWRIGWQLAGRYMGFTGPTRTHDVATKAPNQFGLYDMSGNIWEWCEDVCVELDQVPADGSPYRGPGSERRLRGGCHTNWDLHCRVWWRYGIVQDAHDSCLGFRLVLA